MIQLLIPFLAVLLQEEVVPPSQGFPAGFRQTTWTLVTDHAQHLSADLEDSSAEVELTQHELSLGVLHVIDMQNILSASVAGEFVSYQFSNLNTLLPGAPADFDADVLAWRSDVTFLQRNTAPGRSASLGAGVSGPGWVTAGDG